MTARDPGLQPERTRLAWRRTALTVTVVALLLGRLAVVTGGVTTAAAVALALTTAAWLGLQVVTQRRVRMMRSPRPAPAPVALPLTVGATVAALALIGTALVWL